MSKYYYLGMDVSKGYADIIILDQNKNIIEPNFQLDDTFDGHSLLFQILSDLIIKHKPDMIYAAVESTGGYENNWFYSLKKFQSDISIKVARINPTGIYYNSKADLKRVTTDRISALSIAEYLISHPEKVNYNTDDYFVDLRKQKTFVKLLKSQRTQLLNQFESLYYEAFPEIVDKCKSGVPQWVQILMKKYPTASLLAQVSPEVVSEIPYISEEKAVELIELAKNSIASSQGPIIQELIRSTIDQIMEKTRIIKAQTKAMIAECQLPEFELLKSFPGISDWSAMSLLMEIGTIERFPSVKKLVAYFGLNPSFKQSGDGISKVMMSKQGRVEPRRVLFMVVLSGIKNNPIIERTYNRLCDRGMAPLAAMGACMHKALRIIYGMLKNNTTFDETIDIKNQEKASNKKETIKESKDRRYQKYDAKAPISRRQNKKRTAGDQPQNVNNIECGV
jgi:transposase